MIYKFLYQNKWKESIRSSIWQKNVVVNIILGIFIVYFLVNFLVLGIVTDKLLMEIFPDEDPVIKFNGLLFYFIFIDLFIRFLGQTVPTLSIQPYLHLPVKRSSLMHYLLGRSITNPINYFYFVIFIPFAIKAVSTIYNTPTALLWLLMLLIITMFNNFLITYIKRQMGSKPWIALTFGLIIAGFILLDSMKIFSLQLISENIFTSIMLNPIFITFLFGLLLTIYFINYRFLISNAYLENLNKNQSKKSISTANISFFNRFGIIGELINLEIRLTLRNKRPKTILYMSPLFLLYGFFFYPNDMYMNMNGMLIFVGIFITGGIMMSYGNYLISWESSYFDALLTKSFDFKKYFQAKIALLAVVTIVSYLITLPYLFLDIKLLYINTACFIFNLGFNINVVLFFALNNKKYLDLSKGGAFNYQGLGASNFIVMLPMLIIPILIYVPFSMMDMPKTGLLILSGIGILGIILQKPITNLVIKRFYKQKYEMAEGFRQH
jgi:hypothetical protein